MKKIKKTVSIILVVMLIFSSLSASCASFAVSVNTSADAEISESTEASEGLTAVTEVFEQIVAKIKKIILILVGNISIILDGNYSKLDVSEFSSDAFAVPGLDEGFVPQGICYIELLDAYAVSGYVKGENSRIYLVTPETQEVKKLELKDFSKHAGGIASDGNDIWVCAGGNENEGGYVYHTTAMALSWASDGDMIEFDGSFQTQVRASALCCDGEMLYVAEFYEKDDYPVNSSHKFGDNNARAVGYELPVMPTEYNGEEKMPDLVLSIPDKVQGMAVSKDGDIVFSTSYGRFYDSTLHIYKPLESWTQGGVVYNGEVIHLCVADEKSLVTKIKMPTLMEGIDIEGDMLYAVFESGAQAYSDAKEITPFVRAVNFNEIKSKIN